MKKIVFTLVFAGVVLLACSTKQKDNGDNDVPTQQMVADEEVNVLNLSDSGTINLKLVNGEGSAKIGKKENQTVYIEFINNGYKKVTAHLSSSDSLANIRFSQIFLPDKTMDGPFGRDIEYQLPTDGLYKLSVNENMMAGDPWSGIFNIYLKLEK